jgi:hypothetical protein
MKSQHTGKGVLYDGMLFLNSLARVHPGFRHSN